MSRRRPDVPEPPQLAAETLEENRRQYARCLDAFAALRKALEDAGIDLVVIVGDDQSENFHEQNMPPFCVFVGEELYGYPFRCLEQYFGEAPGERMEVAADVQAALRVVEGLYGRGFDPAYARELPDQRWGLPHSHIRVLYHVLPRSSIRVVPIHVNAYHPPCPTPARCYAFGRALREVIERDLDPNLRVALYGSGGLSHDPYGPFGGVIDEEHDRWVLAQLQEGRGEHLASLSSDDLRAHLDVELRNWIIVAGAVGTARPTFVEYVPSYRTVVGMGFAVWNLT